MNSMPALWLENQQLSFCPNAPIPAPAAGEALLRLRLTGICATDIEMVRGYYPFTGIPGHEFVAEVVAVNGADPSSWIGQRVVGEINVFCGNCPECLAGRTTHCQQRQVLGLIDHFGVFTQFVCLPLKILHRIPDSIHDDDAVFTEPLAAAIEIQEQIAITADQRVLVIGVGRLGQLIAATLAATGCKLAAEVRHKHPWSLSAARNIPQLEEFEIMNGAWDVVVEATGSIEGFKLARRAVRPRGTIVLKSTYHGEDPINLSSIVVDEVTLIGSRCGPFAKALEVLKLGWLKPSELITARYPLTQGLQAFEHATRPGALKILIQP
jgi:threonine dehydrogenase-like Zn-dependent dehydrogenase